MWDRLWVYWIIAGVLLLVLHLWMNSWTLGSSALPPPPLHARYGHRLVVQPPAVPLELARRPQPASP